LKHAHGRTDMTKVLGALSDYVLVPNNTHILHTSDQIPRTSIILTSMEEHFAPLDATVEGLGLILVSDINYCDNICLQAQGETVPESGED
jgi:hypothetical protein